MPVGVDADVRRDVKRAFDDVARRQFALHEGEGRGLRETAAGTNGDQIVLWLDHIAGARYHVGAVDIGHAQQRFQAAQAPIAARVRLPNFSSLPSKRSNKVNASAVPPANPASTLSPYRRRTLRALDFITLFPKVTWPSPPTATRPLRRTARIVVP